VDAALKGGEEMKETMKKIGTGIYEYKGFLIEKELYGEGWTTLKKGEMNLFRTRWQCRKFADGSLGPNFMLKERRNG
jgi:hypothetical protein